MVLKQNILIEINITDRNFKQFACCVFIAYLTHQTPCCRNTYLLQHDDNEHMVGTCATGFNLVSSLSQYINLHFVPDKKLPTSFTAGNSFNLILILKIHTIFLQCYN